MLFPLKCGINISQVRQEAQGADRPRSMTLFTRSIFKQEKGTASQSDFVPKNCCRQCRQRKDF